MPVRKFRSVEEMSRDNWRRPGDPQLYRTMRSLWELGVRTSQRRYPPGVHRHSSIGDMSRTQQRWAAIVHRHGASDDVSGAQ